MAPQKKAMELRSIFYKIIDYNSGDTVADKNADELAIQCVNEIIMTLKDSLIEWHVLNTDEILEYWQQVKENLI